LNNRFIAALKAGEVAPGGMKNIELEGYEIVICNLDGRFYAIDRRCGHTNAPLEKGTLDGKILTCAMHFVQFDATTGEALSGPVPHDFGGEMPPPRMGQYLQGAARLIEQIKTNSIRTYETRVESGMVWVAM
jgi:3-phenylpropionate/trans-cinnamate dioxygenase ferredoxin subunit